MKIIMANSTNEAIDVVVSHITEKLLSHPSSVIGLATGKTMEPVYSLWAKKHVENNWDFSKAFFFMLDEYLGLPKDHPSTFRMYITNKVLRPLKLHEDQFAFPPTNENLASHYEQSIVESGGIDLQILGIGQNGHIGFNEPGSLKDSRTRVVGLTKETLEANKRDITGDIIPERAISMGIGTILEAKSIILLATGKSKADAIKYLLNHHDDPSCPATYLKHHPNFILVVDPDASSKINLKI